MLYDDPRTLTLALIFPLLGAAPAAAQTPFPSGSFTGFEEGEGFAAGPLRATLGWEAVSGSPSIEGDAAASGAHSLRVPAGDPGAEVRYSGAGTGGVAFLDLQVAGVDGAPEGFIDFEGAVSGLLRIGQDAGVHAFDGDGEGGGEWVDTGLHLPGAGAAPWVRLTVRVDPDAGVWDLFVSGRPAAADLGLRGGGFAEPLELIVVGGGVRDLLVDDVYVGPDNPLFDDRDRDGIDDQWGGGPGAGGRGSDVDADGLTRIEEFVLGGDPLHADSDGDGADDGDEFRSGTPLDVPGDVLPAQVRLETWATTAPDEEGGGDSVTLRSLRDSGTFAGKTPTGAEMLHRLEIAEYTGDNYSSRVRGYLVAPVSGDYDFWISGDDEAEFWLSTDASRANARPCVWLPSFTRFREWDRFRSQQRSGVGLVAGERYYFELRHVEREREDHLAVAWTVPGARRALISSAHVEDFLGEAGDADGDGLPDTWESRHGLSPGDALGASGWDGDPDGDHLANWRELQLGTDPSAADAAGRAGLVRRESWTPVWGAYVADLVTAGAFPEAPAEVGYLTALESPPSQGERRGERLRGFLVPPESGEFTFHIAGDDQSQLWLSRDRSPYGRELVAEVPTATGFREWDRFPEQASAPVGLVAGQRYYFEVLHQNGRGDSHLTVGWKRPGGVVIEVIGGDHLAAAEPVAGDADDDGLPDAWQAASGLGEHGLAGGPAAAAWAGDPDRDGVNNLEEMRSGTDPLKADAATGENGMLCEVWWDLKGNWVGEDLARSGRFPGEPSHTRRLYDLDYASIGDNYAARVRGYVIPPEDGEYTFYLSGSRNVLAWLSPGDDPFAREPLASVSYWSHRRHSRMQVTQESAPVPLEAGRRYYLEVLHKAGERFDHLSLEWSRAGGSGRGVVRGEYLEPFVPGEGDADDDGLPDLWEAESGLAALPGGFDAGSFGDPDGDRLDNHSEFLAGTDPLAADSAGVPGYARWDVWWDLPGTTVDRLTSSRRFPSSPTGWRYFSSLTPDDRIGDRYAARMRALLVPASTGTYTFAVAGDDSCQLFVGTSESKFSKRLVAGTPGRTELEEWAVYPGQVSGPVRLERGKRYYIELLHKESTGPDHVTVRWLEPGGSSFERVEGSDLVSFSPDPDDLDDDELPDAWEQEHGLDAGEVRDDYGYWGDPDGDGMPNAAEFAAGTDPSAADTDGDGLTDFVEVELVCTDPLAAEASAALSEVEAVDASEVLGVPASWSLDDDGVLRSGARRGSFEFAVDLPRTGRYVFELSVSTSDSAPSYESFFRVALDGFEFESGAAPEGVGDTVVRGLMPAAAAGSHLLRFTWENARRGRWVSVHGLKLYHVGGADGDGDGLPDWLGSRLAAANGVGAPPRSFVSPAWVEGIAEFPGRTRVVSSLGSGALEPETILLPGDGWGFDLPLEEDGSPTAFTAGFDAGVYRVDGEVAWAALDLLAEDAEVPVLRAGDALRITALEPAGEPAGGSGGFRVVAAGEAVATGLAFGEAVVVEFSDPGSWDVAVEVLGEAGEVVVSRVHGVEVVAGAFGPPVALDVAQGREVEFPALHHAGPVDRGPALRWVEMASASSGRKAFLESSVPGSHPLALRVDATERSPVVAGGAVRVIDVLSGNDSHIGLAGTLADGTRVVEMDIVAPGLPPGAGIELTMFVAGVTFEDGSTRLLLSAGDFGEDGVATVRFLQAPGTGTAVCHRLRVVDPPEEPEAGGGDADGAEDDTESEE